ncbi:MAG: O-antigen ligase family protein [Mycobacteriales bacterium]
MALRRRLDLVLPGAALLGVLVPLLPSLLLRIGVPLTAVRPYTYYKDLAVVVVLSCLAESGRRESGPLDAVERWGLAFIGLVTLYLLLPLASPGADALPFNIRSYGWRFDVEWLIFLLGLRRLRLPPRTAQYFMRTLYVITALEVAATTYEKLRPHAWETFLTATLRVPNYLSAALGSSPLLADVNDFGTGKALRAGGLTANSLSTGFIMVILLAALAPHLAATRVSRRMILLLGGSLVALSLTLTRSAVLSGLVVLLFVLSQRATPLLASRARGTLLVTTGLLVAAPFLLGSDLVRRTTSAFTGSDPSAEAHSQGSSTALSLARDHLLGFGLGTNPNVANRFGVVTITAENTFLQTALELGVLGLVLLAGLLLSLVVSCLRTHRALGGSALHLGAAAAAVGVLVQSLFLEPFSDLPTAFLFAALVAVAQPVRGDPALNDYEPVTTDR